MLGRLIQEKDSIVVGKRRKETALLLENVAVGGLRCSVLNRKSAGVPEDTVADRSLRFPAFCNALGERRSQRGRNCQYSIRYSCTRVHML